MNDQGLEDRTADAVLVETRLEELDVAQLDAVGGGAFPFIQQ